MSEGFSEWEVWSHMGILFQCCIVLLGIRVIIVSWAHGTMTKQQQHARSFLSSTLTRGWTPG